MLLAQIPWAEYLNQLLALAEQVGYTNVLATGAGAYAAYKALYALYFSPFSSIPGPLLAKLTNKRAELLGTMGIQAHKALEDYEKYGDIYVFRPDSVSISNPADIRTVLGSQNFRKADSYKNLESQGIPTTITARDPKFASMRRRQIGPYFSSSYLARMEQAILKHGILAIKEKLDSLLKAKEDGQVEINYHQMLFYASFDTIGSLAFGRDFGSLKNDDSTIAKWFKANFAYFGIRLMFPLFSVYPFSLALEPLRRLYMKYRNYATKCITERRELLAELEENGEVDRKPVDLLQGLIDCLDPESKVKMSPMEVQVESMLMITAGSETTSNTLTWTIHLLMLYPLCYKRAVDEVRSAFARDHLIAYGEAKAKLPYLEACFHESMRMIPVGGGQIPRRTPDEGVTLSGHFIPGGTEINCNIFGAHHNQNYWTEPHLFEPTRFLGNSEAKRNLFTFSHGARVCPGKQLAWVEMLTVLANLLKDYDLRLPADYTLHGPNVLNQHGYPKVMGSKLFVTTAPANIERDCRLIVSQRK